MAYLFSVFSQALYAKSPKHYSDILSPELPPDIAVAADVAVQNQTTVAMDKLSQRLGFTWHFAPISQAEIYVHWVSETDGLAGAFEGQAWMPGDRRYNGIANIRSREPWVIEHEVLHLLGFPHSASGLMRGNHDNFGDQTITDKEIHYAMLVRMAASQQLIAARKGPANGVSK